MLVGLLPVWALAVDDVPSVDLHWDADQKQLITENQTVSSPTAVASNTIWGSSGNTTWYVVTGELIINNRVTVEGDVRLILADGCNLTVNGGINAADNDNDISNGSTNALTIYAQQNNTGKLTAKVPSGENRPHLANAGIGGDEKQNSGTITINGGEVTAIGGNWAAGIGGGDATGLIQNGHGGNITINGGNITAKSFNDGAGIGGGASGSSGNFSAGTAAGCAFPLRSRRLTARAVSAWRTSSTVRRPARRRWNPLPTEPIT